MTGVPVFKARDRRVVKAGLAACALILAVAKGPARLRAIEDRARAEHREAVEALARARTLRTATGMRASGRMTITGDGATPGIAALVARSESEALSQLAQRIATLASFSGVQIHEATPRPSMPSEAGIGRIAMRFTMTAGSEALFALLREVELGPTLVRVRRLEVTQRDPGADQTVPETLRIELELVALLRLGDEGKRS